MENKRINKLNLNLKKRKKKKRNGVNKIRTVASERK